MILDEKEKGGERREGEEGERKVADEKPPVEERIRLEKSNILLLGPTGSGKCEYKKWNLHVLVCYMYKNVHVHVHVQCRNHITMH